MYSNSNNNNISIDSNNINISNHGACAVSRRCRRCPGAARPPETIHYVYIYIYIYM